MKEKSETRVNSGCLIILIAILEFYAIFLTFLNSAELSNKYTKKVDTVVHCDTIPIMTK